MAEKRKTSSIFNNDEFLQLQKAMEGSTILVCGPPGAGKSLFCMQYLVDQIKYSQIQGIYLSLEESWINLLRDFVKFPNWDVFKHLRQGNLLILDTITPPVNNNEELTNIPIVNWNKPDSEKTPEEIAKENQSKNVLRKLYSECNKNGEPLSDDDLKQILKGIFYFPIKEKTDIGLLTSSLNREIISFLKITKRNLDALNVSGVIIIDSITALLSRQVSEKGDSVIESKIREIMIWVKSQLENQVLTTLMPAEMERDGTLRFGNESFIARGVIELNYEEQSGELVKYFRIRKMRGAKIPTKKFLTSIDENGFKISGELM